MMSAQQDYQANLEAFNVAKTLALRTLRSSGGTAER